VDRSDRLRARRYLGTILKLCQDRRGIQRRNLTYVAGRAQLTYELR